MLVVSISLWEATKFNSVVDVIKGSANENDKSGLAYRNYGKTFRTLANVVYA